jgi:hypothetical protein
MFRDMFCMRLDCSSFHPFLILCVQLFGAFLVILIYPEVCVQDYCDVMPQVSNCGSVCMAVSGPLTIVIYFRYLEITGVISFLFGCSNVPVRYSKSTRWWRPGAFTKYFESSPMPRRVPAVVPYVL